MNGQDPTGGLNQAHTGLFNFQTNGSSISWTEVCRHRKTFRVAWEAEQSTRIVPKIDNFEAFLQVQHSTDLCFGCQIFSRHESVLNTHLEMLDSVKDHVAPDGEAFRTVSSMVNKTVQAMNQFRLVRKHMVCGYLSFFFEAITTDATSLQLNSMSSFPTTGIQPLQV